VKDGKATEGRIRLPIPSEAEVRWAKNEKNNVLKVKFKGAVPTDFTDGTIYLIIKSDGSVDVKAILLNDINGNSKVEK
jgi:hypothetical protein